jgi:hypothetical protein
MFSSSLCCIQINPELVSNRLVVTVNSNLRKLHGKLYEFGQLNSKSVEDKRFFKCAGELDAKLIISRHLSRPFRQIIKFAGREFKIA